MKIMFLALYFQKILVKKMLLYHQKLTIDLSIRNNSTPKSSISPNLDDLRIILLKPDFSN